MPRGELLVLDEPFVGVDEAVRADLLEIVRTASADRQLVLLTEDAEVLGWAIELPDRRGHRRSGRRPPHPDPPVQPRAQPGDPGADATAPTVADAAAAPTDDTAPPDVDITTPTTIDTDQEAAPTIRRWAGQR